VWIVAKKLHPHP